MHIDLASQPFILWPDYLPERNTGGRVRKSMMDSMEKSMRTLSSAARNRTKKYTTKNTDRVKSI